MGGYNAHAWASDKIASYVATVQYRLNKSLSKILWLMSLL